MPFSIRPFRRFRFPLSLINTFCVLALCLTSLVHAETKSITSEATYIMGDGESPSFAEAMALQKAKQLALEEAGTYVESYTKTLNQDLTKEEIQILAGGVLQVEVLEKTRNLISEGLRVYLKIRATVTTDKMEELAQRIKGKNVAEEYKDLRVKYETLTKEITELKQTIAKSPPSIERDTALNHIREREQSFTELQRDETALFKKMVLGESMVAEAKQVLQLSDFIVHSMLGPGLLIAIEGPKPTLLRQQPGKIQLELDVTSSISDNLFANLRKAAQERGATEEDVSVLPGDLPSSYYRKDDKNRHRVNPILRAKLFRFPDTKEIREELWHLRDTLRRIRLIVEFLGEKNPLEVCRLDYRGHMYPGVEQGDKNQEMTWLSQDITDEVTSTPKYFGSEAEYREYNRLHELVKSAFKRLEKIGNKKGEEEKVIKEIGDEIDKMNKIDKPAQKRWLSEHPPLFRIKKSARGTLEPSTISPSLLVVNEAYSSSAVDSGSSIFHSIMEDPLHLGGFTIKEDTLNQVKQITAHLELEDQRYLLSKFDWDDYDVRHPCKETTPGSGKTFHTVKAGETLYDISQTYGAAVDKLRKWNNLPDDFVEMGQRLIVDIY